jgi:protein TonB
MFLMAIYLGQKEEKVELTFSIIENFKVAPEAKSPVLNIQKPKVEKEAPAQKRKVYGLSRKAVTSATGVDVKTGNTLAKTPDDLKLNKDDADSIPIPTDEFLITSMPKVIEEIRPQYPESQKKLGKEGKVIFEIIIDANGVVREAIMIQSLGPEFDQAAKEAILRFKFRPALMEKNAVPVKIKYAINFVLEK